MDEITKYEIKAALMRLISIEQKEIREYNGPMKHHFDAYNKERIEKYRGLIAKIDQED